jgi:hypothetical protein
MINPVDSLTSLRYSHKHKDLSAAKIPLTTKNSEVSFKEQLESAIETLKPIIDKPRIDHIAIPPHQVEMFKSKLPIKPSNEPIPLYSIPIKEDSTINRIKIRYTDGSEENI